MITPAAISQVLKNLTKAQKFFLIALPSVYILLFISPIFFIFYREIVLQFNFFLFFDSISFFLFTLGIDFSLLIIVISIIMFFLKPLGFKICAGCSFIVGALLVLLNLVIAFAWPPLMFQNENYLSPNHQQRILSISELRGDVEGVDYSHSPRPYNLPEMYVLEDIPTHTYKILARGICGSHESVQWVDDSVIFKQVPFFQGYPLPDPITINTKHSPILYGECFATEVWW